MADRTTIDDSAEGNKVINSDGEEIGVVTAVRSGTAYVDPNPGITDKLMSSLGWDSVDEGDYPLREEAIDRVTDDEIYLRRDF